MRVLLATPGEHVSDTARRALFEKSTHIWHNERLHRVYAGYDEEPCAAGVVEFLKLCPWQVKTIEVAD